MEEIHKYLTNSDFSEKVLGVTWKNAEGERMPILKPLLPPIKKDLARKAPNGKDVYYVKSITLDGVEYLVYNNWLNEVRTRFFTWVKNTIFPELEDLENCFNRSE